MGKVSWMCVCVTGYPVTVSDLEHIWFLNLKWNLAGLEWVISVYAHHCTFACHVFTRESVIAAPLLLATSTNLYLTYRYIHHPFRVLVVLPVRTANSFLNGANVIFPGLRRCSRVTAVVSV